MSIDEIPMDELSPELLAIRMARNTSVVAWQLQAVVDVLIAKGFITQDEIDAASTSAVREFEALAASKAEVTDVSADIEQTPVTP